MSNDGYNRKTDDIVVVAMTSNLQPSDYGFVITSNDLEIGSLRRPSRVRVDKIYTLAQSIAVKKFGRVNEITFDRICDLLAELISISESTRIRKNIENTQTETPLPF